MTFLPTPTDVGQFSKEWLMCVLQDWFTKNDINPDSVEIVDFSAKLNGLQGLLSTTYIVDINFKVDDEEPQLKSIFVKVPLTGPAGENFKGVNVREHSMLGKVLPSLQQFIEEHCTDILSLPIPEIIYSRYCGDELTDAFILENLVAEGFSPYKDGDLVEENLKSCLECLAQLHGTGIAYKLHLGGKEKLLAKFPEMEEQSQVKDVLDTKEARKKLRRNYLPFLKYLEEVEPSLLNYTGFLTKIEPRLFQILKKIDSCGLENFLTLCHGDSKPDNFMFRKIEIDLEDMECEGLEGILIDWQGGFMGMVSNDLMWLLPPFIEANSENKGMLEFALEHYSSQMQIVLSSFGKTAKDVGLPENVKEFSKVIKRCFLLEFLNVVVINPIMQIPEPVELRTWYRKALRHQQRLKEEKVSKAPVLPKTKKIFQNDNFPKFASLYLKLGFILGGFTELNSLNFELVRESMFSDGDVKSASKDEEGLETDVYDDEELELSEDVDMDDETSEGESLLSRILRWILSLFNCNKFKS